MEDNRSIAASAIERLDGILTSLANERDGLIQETVEQSNALFLQDRYIQRLQTRIRELETMLGVGHKPVERPADTAIPAVDIGESAVTMANKITNLRQRATDMENALIIGAKLEFNERDMLDREIEYKRAMAILTTACIHRAKALGVAYQQGLLED